MKHCHESPNAATHRPRCHSTSFNMSDHIDYAAIGIPEDGPPDDYHYTTRRAEILQMIESAGHPKLLNQARLGERYGCDKSNIHNDLDVLGEYIAENLGSRRELVVESVFQRAVEGLTKDSEWRKAAQTAKDYDEWLTERTEMEELTDRIEEIEAAYEGHRGVSLGVSNGQGRP